MTAPPPIPQPRQYHLSRNGDAVGPYEKIQVAEMLQCNQISETDLVWYDGAPNWMPISSIKNELIGSPQPPPIPQAPPIPSQIQSPIQELQALIQGALSRHPKVEETFVSSAMNDKNRGHLNAIFPTFAPNNESLLLAGLYCHGPFARTPKLGIAITDRNFYSSTANLMGFPKTSITPLNALNTLAVNYTDDLLINGKSVGSLQRAIPDTDGEMLKDLFALINSTGILLKLR